MKFTKIKFKFQIIINLLLLTKNE